MPSAEFEPALIALRVTRRPGIAGPDATALEVPPEGLTIGRSADCAVVLADPLRLVSRQHAQVIAVGEVAQVRCISSRTPLWVNGLQLDPDGERSLSVGDRLRIGGFELAVESVAATATRRSRLDRWFDLEGAPDPLAAESPLPALEASPEVPAASAVVSWKSDRHVVRTEPALIPGEGEMPREPLGVAESKAPQQASAPPTLQAPTTLQAPATSQGAATSRTPATSRTRATSRTPRMPHASPAIPAPLPAAPVPAAAGQAGSPGERSLELSELSELAAAFGRGAGLDTVVAPLTVEWMEHLGALLRATAEGTLALLQSRAVTKRQMRAEGTHITPRQNNPLKFSPDATEALTRMLQRDASPGFLDPVAALHDAHHDLLVHQVAMVAGMRAAVFELFSRLGPEAAEQGEGPAHGLSRLPLLRAAALWQRHRMQHAHLLEHLDDDFETIFGREFLRAYEAQSRVDEDAGPKPDSATPEEPWPIYAR